MLCQKLRTWKYTLSSDTKVFAMSAMVTVLQAHETPEALLTWPTYFCLLLKAHNIILYMTSDQIED